MAADPGIVETLRADLAELGQVEERAMFGAHCFFLAGHMVGCAHLDGAMYRVGPDARETALAEPGVTPQKMGARVMKGYVALDAEHVPDDGLRGRLTELALSHVRSLPRKGTA